MSKRLEELRKNIDKIDNDIFKLLNNRFEITNEIGEIKKASSISVENSEREREILGNINANSSSVDISNAIISIYKKLFDLSKNLQRKIMAEKKKILLINGPNINILEKREVEHYKGFSYEELVNAMKIEIENSDFDIEFFQSNSESKIIDKIQSTDSDALIINPAAFTHSSIAILDVLLSLKIPVVEVHISNLAKREDFRQKLVTSRASLGLISGFGIKSYILAFKYLQSLL